MKQQLFLFGTAISLLAAAGYLLLAPALYASPSNTIMVTTTSDAIANDGQCALREAIIAANTDSAFYDCAAGSGADTVSFDAGLSLPAVFALSIAGANEDLAASGDLDVSGTLTIMGTGAGDIILDGNGADRVLDIRPGAHVTINGVTVRNGNPIGSVEGGGIRVAGSLTLNSSIVTNNQMDGIFNNGGALTLNDVQLSNNSGYGVQNLNQAVLTFNDGGVSGNQAGGVSNATSTAVLNNLVIADNKNGGGVRNTGGTLSHLSLGASSVISNTATNGGGVYNNGVGAVTDIVNSTIRGNTAVSSGGGVYNNGSMVINGSTIDHNQARSGGGIDHSGSSLHMTNDTVSGNGASNNGGGLYNRGSATLTHLTFSGNTANGPETGGNIFNDTALLTLQNSLVANSDADGNCFSDGGFVTSSGNNLDDGDTCAFGSAGDLVNSDPQLGPLQANGGPTFTQALLPGSAAIDHAKNSFCPATDQRGQPRPAGACDIGAYEAVATADLSLSVVTSPLLVSVDDVMTYTLTVTNEGTLAASALLITDTLPVEVTYLDAFGSGGVLCSYSSVVTCTLPALAAGDSVTAMIFVGTPVFETTVVNYAEVASATLDLNPDNDAVTTTTAVAIIRTFYLPLVFRN